MNENLYYEKTLGLTASVGISENDGSAVTSALPDASILNRPIDAARPLHFIRLHPKQRHTWGSI